MTESESPQYDAALRLAIELVNRLQGGEPKALLVGFATFKILELIRDAPASQPAGRPGRP
ncbi:hypothetical protein [Paludisphaera rhizosphaerae]|uniref:hypothetical protein n=1 Tax=Paludisphaera rhizosphaerae TaxID=2711216 RepID=UPI0013EC2DE7|nr:hypothetical protein [Paludisphaera rhizosphaerae]